MNSLLSPVSRSGLNAISDADDKVLVAAAESGEPVDFLGALSPTLEQDNLRRVPDHEELSGNLGSVPQVKDRLVVCGNHLISCLDLFIAPRKRSLSTMDCTQKASAEKLRPYLGS